MTIGQAQLYHVLVKLGQPIRLPTACWLFSDLCGMLDMVIRVTLSDMKDEGIINIDNGGWITLNR